MENELKYWLALSAVRGIERFPVSGLLSRFGSPEEIFSQTGAALEGFSTEFAKAIKGFKDWGWVDEEIDRVESFGARVIAYSDPAYPPLLRQIYDPPFLLYSKGASFDYDAPSIAVVGTRHPTHYGLRMSEVLSKDLAASGVTVVSGMARGCDMAAHMGALKGGGFTVAVLGTGIDVPYPRESVKLYEEIMEKGLVVSEFPMKTPPAVYNFPRRNRIISGLSLATLVIEAPLRSGALMTAKLSLDYNREVMAIPGPVTSNKSAGTNRLIKEGAALVSGVPDIMEALSLSYVTGEEEKKDARPALSKEEGLIWKALGIEPLHIDGIIEKTGLPASKTSAMLLDMELKGLIRQEIGKRFVRGF